MKQLLLIFIGGGLGSIFRYAITNLSSIYFTKIPFHTLISNTIGCLIFGLIMGWAIKSNQINSPQTLLFTVGFCGGLTTFSTFANENINLLKSGEINYFIFYTFISIMTSIASILIGIQLTK